MEPRPGPPRCTLMMTPGRSAPAMYEMPSLFSEMPGLDEEVMTRAPAAAAP